MEGESYLTVDDGVSCMTLYIKNIGFHNNSLLVSLCDCDVSIIFDVRD